MSVSPTFNHGVAGLFVYMTMFAQRITGVGAYYCDSGKCDEDEYCCGYNTCCTAYVVWQNWYFWCGMLFFMLLLSACASFWRYRLLYYRATVLMQAGPHSYAQLQQHLEDEDADGPDITIHETALSSGLSNHYAKYISQTPSGDYRPMPPPYSQQLPKEPPPPYSG